VRRKAPARFLLAIFVVALACAAAAAGASAASREPLSILRAALNREPVELPAAPPAGAGARRLVAAASNTSPSAAPAVSSTAYGPEQTEAVGRIVTGLLHGPELSAQHIFVAAPEEVAGRCGAGVIACYFPAATEMVVAGSGGSRGGVPREFAIAHEYGHAIAAGQAGPLGAPIDTGTIRWATYERVCQLSRAGVLFPGNQGAHYWQDPEEAFAETYAHVADPAASVSWQFSPYLAPTAASLAEVRADVTHPWGGPTTASWSGSVPAPSAGAPRTWHDGRAGLSSARALGVPPGTVVKSLATPLDGEVAVDLTTGSATPLVVRLVDPESGHVLARADTDVSGAASLSFQNCGHESLQLQVRSRAGAASFAAQISRP
jgi:hypothetical protein